MGYDAHAEVKWDDLLQSRRTIVFADVVESVRIMQAHEREFIIRWLRVVDALKTDILTRHGGALARSYGDGLLLEFGSTAAAVAAAEELHALAARSNEGCPDDAALKLRIGIHVADIVRGEFDIYGSGVNLAARLASLAGPCETVVSAAARDLLVDRHDGDIVDLGACFLKHYAEPVRAYRVAAADPQRQPEQEAPPERPGLAVLPFECSDADSPTSSPLGDALADDVISAMSRTTSLTLVSRLSTQALRACRATAPRVRAMLGAAYMIGGSFRLMGSRIAVVAELRDLRDGRLLWQDSFSGPVADLFEGASAIATGIALAAGREVLQAEFERARLLPVPTLQAYTLYLGGVMMLHRLAQADFLRARELFEHLAQRYPRRSGPLAMLAKWHVLCLSQGWSPDRGRSAQEARSAARRALDVDPHDALAWAMEGAAIAHLGGDLSEARRACEAATLADPQEPHAWLTLGGIHSYVGEAELAEAYAQRAVELSPLDPARFLFEVFIAAARLVNGRYDEAAQAARASIRGNAMHAVSHRLLTIALALGGRIDEARRSATDLMRIDPGFSVSLYASRYAGRHQPHAPAYFKALEMAGVPP